MNESEVRKIRDEIFNLKNDMETRNAWGHAKCDAKAKELQKLLEGVK